MRRGLALLLCAILATSGCATVNRASMQPPPRSSSPGSRVDRALMAEYIRQLPVGSLVKINRSIGAVIHGTLMKRDTDPIVVQRRTRLPEEPITIPIGDILALELESDQDIGRMIAIGILSGTGATLGVLMLLFAIAGD
jgi:hypothetical protein